jgi:phage shock protein PspC (stress-responsive transcriptional regulator)
MKKNIHIQLSKYGFFIEEDAYHILLAWFDKIKSNLEGEPYREEIIQDLELRLADLWFDKHKNQSTVTLADVQQAIEIIGDPETIKDNTGSNRVQDEKITASVKPKKRLYRDPDDFVLGGVCSGIAAYFNVDPVIVRIIAILLVFLAGTSFWVYIILWIIIPEAKTTAQKLEMKGEPWNWDNLKDELSKKARHIQNESNGFFKRIRKSPQTKNILYSIINFCGIIIGVISLFIGITLFIALLGIIISSLSIVRVSDFEILNSILSRHISFFWTKLWLYFLLGSLFLFFTYTGIKLIFKIRGSKWAYPSIITLFIISTIGLGMQVFSVVTFLKNPKHYSELFTFRPLSDTLIVKSNHSSYEVEQFKTVTLNMKGISGYYLKYIKTDDEENIKLIIPVKIVRTSDSLIKIKVDYKLYDKKIEKINSKPEDHFYFSDKKNLILKTFFETKDKNDLLRIKNYTLYVPEKISLITEPKNTKTNEDYENLSENYDEDREIKIILDDKDILKIVTNEEKVKIDGKIINLEVEESNDDKKIKIKINNKNKKINETGN